MVKEALISNKQGFWGELKKPFFAMAPMDGITDFPFREIVRKCGKPDVFFTEFVSADGLCSKGRNNLARILKFVPAQRPIVAQLFGANPENFFIAAKYLKKLKFDGIDINMGCPHKIILKQGAGAALINNPKLACKIIYEAKRGANNIPVSVKTRLCDNNVLTNKWMRILLNEEPAAITIHGRTVKQGFSGLADWDAIGMIKSCALSLKSKTLIIGNGDVKTLLHAFKLSKTYKLDGVMAGRSVMSNPFFFSKNASIFENNLDVKLKALIEHAELADQFYRDNKLFVKIRKFIVSYISGFNNAKIWRRELMNAENLEEIKTISARLLKTNCA